MIKMMKSNTWKYNVLDVKNDTAMLSNKPQHRRIHEHSTPLPPRLKSENVHHAKNVAQQPGLWHTRLKVSLSRSGPGFSLAAPGPTGQAHSDSPEACWRHPALDPLHSPS